MYANISPRRHSYRVDVIIGISRNPTARNLQTVQTATFSVLCEVGSNPTTSARAAVMVTQCREAMSLLELVRVFVFFAALLENAGEGRANMSNLLNGQAVLHVRFDGRSLDVPLSGLDIGPASPDLEVKRRPCLAILKSPGRSSATTSWIDTKQET